MPGVKPFFIVGKIVEVNLPYEIAYAKVINGNVYHLHPSTPGVDFYKLEKDQRVELEVTDVLVRVLSARLLFD